MTDQASHTPASAVEAAVEAFQRGYTPVPIRAGGKAPFGTNWQHLRFTSEEQVRASFTKYAEQNAPGIGLALGEASRGLVDVDIDSPVALRLRDHFLPATAMETGRPGNAHSHRWYIDANFDPDAGDDAGLQSTRRYKLPDGSVTVELRSSGGQTVIPPSMWHPKKAGSRPPEAYRWEGSPGHPAQPWGGEEGPTVIDGRVLAVQVALMHLGTVLLDVWPSEGGRHDAYLALAGGLLRWGDDVHPFWERNLPTLIEALADVTHDEDADTRVSETMGSTLAKLRRGDKVQGFPSLAESIGNDHAEMARRAAREVEQLAGFDPAEISTRPKHEGDVNAPASDGWDEYEEELPSTLAPAKRNPMEERTSSWESVDLGPYFAGQIEVSKPTVLTREDGHGLFYEGRVNMLFGSSESAKTWICMFAAAQQIGLGERVTFLDLEDDPQGVVDRLRRIGVAADDARTSFSYIHPEAVIASMQRGKFGPNPTPEGEENAEVFHRHLEHFDPTLIVVDGMTMLYGLHGLDTNDAAGTDVIKSWLFSLTRSGRTTVIVIDHTGKNAGAGASPIGAHHKIAMIQGAALRADAVKRPMPGEHGQVRLTVYKDRLGEVRKVSGLVGGNGSDAEQTCGTVHIDSTSIAFTKMWVEAPSGTEIALDLNAAQQRVMEERDRKADLREKVLGLFGGDIDLELKTQDLIDAGLSRKQAYDAWNLLMEDHTLEGMGARKDRRYRLYDEARSERERLIEYHNNHSGRA